MEVMEVLKKARLFQGISEEELVELLRSLQAETVPYHKGQFILHRGTTVRRMGMVLTGAAHLIKEDFWGNRVILAQSGPGQIFAESYACLGDEKLNISVVAAVPTEVMFLDVGRIFQVCTTACAYHTKLIENLTMVLAGRNVMLTQKVEHISQKNTREKLLSYLSGEAQRTGNASFSIPYNRQELADYLSVDRAMCTELGKLKKEGVLDYTKSRFELFDLPDGF